MKKPTKVLCKFLSDQEQEVYTGSGFCQRCQYFNGRISRNEISCLIPKY